MRARVHTVADGDRVATDVVVWTTGTAARYKETIVPSAYLAQRHPVLTALT
jgi:hypothetical protein